MNRRKFIYALAMPASIPNPPEEPEVDVGSLMDTCIGRAGSPIGDMQQLQFSRHAIADLGGVPTSPDLVIPLNEKTQRGAPGAFLLGTGNQLAKSWHQVTRECGIACLEQMAGTRQDSVFTKHWSELQRLYERFFRQCGEGAAQFWTHNMCVTNESIFEDQGFVSEEAQRTAKLLGIDSEVPVASAYCDITLTLHSAALQWLLPAGCNRYDARLISAPQTQGFVKGSASCSVRSKRISPIPKSGNASLWLNKQLFGQEELSASVWEQEASPLLFVAKKKPGPGYRETLVLIDTVLLKLWRLYWSEHGLPWGDCFVLALERNQGKLVYAKMSTGPYQMKSTEVSEWLSRNR